MRKQSARKKKIILAEKRETMRNKERGHTALHVQGLQHGSIFHAVSGGGAV